MVETFTVSYNIANIDKFRKEMPTAVSCSLLAGICAVIEFHHMFDYSFLKWSHKWLLAAVSFFLPS